MAKILNTVWTLAGVVTLVFLGLFLADEMGFTGNDFKRKVKDFKKAVKRIDQDMGKWGEKIRDTTKAQLEKSKIGIIENRRLNWYEPYMDEVTTRNNELRALAQKISTRAGCVEYEKDCIAFALTQWVANEITYWSDSRGKKDDIRSWKQTLNERYGDCEDQTILLSSLLENSGLNTLMFFTPGHVYPGVCFDEHPNPQYIDPQGMAWETNLFINGQSKTQLCFPLEPTSANSMLGHPPREGACIEAVYDPHTKEPVAIQLPECL